MLPFFQSPLRAGLLALLTITPALLCAQTRTWTGGHPNQLGWDTNSNWQGNTKPANGADVVFAGITKLTPDFNISGLSINSLSFASDAGAFTLGSSGNLALTIGAGGVTNNSANPQTITHNLTLQNSQTWNTASGDITVTGNISSGWITLTKTGNGTLHLAGNNSGLTGPAVVNGGTLLLSHNNALGASNYGNTVSSGGTLALQNNITLTEGDITISGAGHSGGGALRNVSGNNTVNADLKLGANATITSAAGQLTLAKEVAAYGYVVTLDGAGSIVSNAQYTGSGRIVVSGSGARTFNGAINTSSGITLSGTGASTFNANLNFNSGVLAVNSGAVHIGAAVNAGTLNHSGGTTTFTGAGNVTIPNFNVTGGEVIFDKSSGHLRSDNITITAGTVSFLNDNQIFEWDDVTLNDGAVLNLNDTVQNIDNLVINGNAVIDFGAGGSTFDINNLTLLGESVLTIVNWSDALDSFFANVNPGSSNLAKIIFDGLGEAAWVPGAGGGNIVPTVPIPEPAAAGAAILGALTLFPFLRRPRRATP